MQKKMAILLLPLACILAEISYAGGGTWSGGMRVNEVRSHANKFTWVGFTTQPRDTCTQWGESMRFNHTTESGKAFLSYLLAAKTSKSLVNIWYTKSTAPGTTQSNGCTNGALSTLNGVGM